jgi:hypothetical protein
MNGLSGAQDTPSRGREASPVPPARPAFVATGKEIAVPPRAIEGTGAAGNGCTPIEPGSAKLSRPGTHRSSHSREPGSMHNIIYLIGLIVVVLAILSFLGLR